MLLAREVASCSSQFSLSKEWVDYVGDEVLHQVLSSLNIGCDSNLVLFGDSYLLISHMGAKSSPLDLSALWLI